MIDPKVARLNALTIMLKQMPHMNKFFVRHEDGQPSAILRASVDLDDFVHFAGEFCPLMDTMVKNLPKDLRSTPLAKAHIYKSYFTHVMMFVEMAYAHYQENPDDYPLRQTIIPNNGVPS